MKVFIFLAVLLTMSYGEISDAFMEKFTTDMKAFLNDCRIKENASQEGHVVIFTDDLREFEYVKVLSRKEGRCLAACILENFKIQKDDAISLEAGLEVIGPIKTQDVDLYNRLKQILKTCLTEVGNTRGRCDVAAKFYDCASKMSKEAV